MCVCDLVGLVLVKLRNGVLSMYFLSAVLEATEV